MRALIVDDVEINRELLAVFLDGWGDVVCVESGEEALKMVEKALENDAYYDLICLDIFMPGMDGHETLKKIREMEAADNGRRATVFMVTGSSSPDDMFGALVYGGCDDYLTKPLMQQSFNDLLIKHGLS